MRGIIAAGCGSGQASGNLAEHFSQVIATDLSAEQLRQARPHTRIDYRVAPAEACGLNPACVDLVVVAQALHWMQCERFYAEARRVLRPGSVLAAWCYGTGSLESVAADATLQDFYHKFVGPYWPPERALVESGYRELPFPQPELAAPPLRVTSARAAQTRCRSCTNGYCRTGAILRCACGFNGP